MPKHEHTLTGQAFGQFQYPTVPLRATASDTTGVLDDAGWL